MSNSRHYIIVTALVIVSTLVLYFFFRVIFQLPFAASAEAGPIDVMMDVHFWMIAFLFSLIMVFILYAIVAFRRREEDEEDGPHIHGNTVLEIAWTVVPSIIVLGFGIWGAGVLNDITQPKPNEKTIVVEGRQWAWGFAYPDEEIASGELVLPVQQPVVLEMEATDVLHSFWVPEFRVKQDLVPGQKTYLRFTPTAVGEYKVRCAEICGLQHAQMLATVRIVEQQEYIAWVEERQSEPDVTTLTAAERGQIWYEVGNGFGCVSCHSLDGTRVVGPTWQGLFGREEALTNGTVVIADEEYIRSSILNPNDQIVDTYDPNQMPANYGEQFAEVEAEIFAVSGVEIDIIDDLIAYIKTIE